MSIPDSPPTRVRYGVMAYLCTLAFILYIDRICIGQAGTAMQAELGLSYEQWGWVGGAFLIAYRLLLPMTRDLGGPYRPAARAHPHRPLVVRLHRTDRLRLELLTRAAARRHAQRLYLAPGDPLPVRRG